MKKTTKLCVAMLALLGIAMFGTSNSVVQKIGLTVNAQASPITEPIFGQPCGDGVYYDLYTDGQLQINGNGAMYDYDNVTDVPWSLYSDSITSISITEGVTHIGKNAFNGITNNTSFALPLNNSFFDQLVSIGDYAFANCGGTSSINLPEGVTSIGAYAFSGDNFTNLTLPESLETIGDNAFEYNDTLQTMIIPAGVKSIGKQTFKNDNNYNQLTVSIYGIETMLYDDMFEGNNNVTLKVFKDTKPDNCFNNPIAGVTKKNIEEFATTKIAVPYPTDKWIHRVGIIITKGTESQDCEVTDYTVQSENAVFDEDIHINSFTGDDSDDTYSYLPYETYYIYNHKDGDFDTDIADENVLPASDDVGDVDPEQLFKAIIEQGDYLAFTLREVQ